MDIKYPDITVNLSAQDGNAFIVIGAVRKALRHEGISNEEIEDFTTEATSGDYDHVIQTCMAWVNVE